MFGITSKCLELGLKDLKNASLHVKYFGEESMQCSQGQLTFTAISGTKWPASLKFERNPRAWFLDSLYQQKHPL